MIKKFLNAFVFVMAFSTVSFASDITGHWRGRIMDQFDVTYDFVLDGEKLTGYTLGPDGNKIEIKDGSVKGGDIAFTINVMDTDLKIKGKIVDNVIKLTFDMQGQEMAFEIKKDLK